MYSMLKSIIGDTIYAGKLGDNRNVLLEMLHSCSPPLNKEAVLKSLQDPKGVIRILVATIAFGMGVECRAVHEPFNLAPRKTLRLLFKNLVGLENHVSDTYCISSQMPSELQEESGGTSSHLLDNDIPNAVLEILENFSFVMFTFKT